MIVGCSSLHPKPRIGKEKENEEQQRQRMVRVRLEIQEQRRNKRRRRPTSALATTPVPPRKQTQVSSDANPVLQAAGNDAGCMPPHHNPSTRSSKEAVDHPHYVHGLDKSKPGLAFASANLPQSRMPTSRLVCRLRRRRCQTAGGSEPGGNFSVGHPSHRHLTFRRLKPSQFFRDHCICRQDKNHPCDTNSVRPKPGLIL